MGCDSSSFLTRAASLRFQSTHPHGVRQCKARKVWRDIQFQSTHPHGVRRSEEGSKSESQGFNPRTHMGCDSKLHEVFSSHLSFNPRTHMGCDNLFLLVIFLVCLFQSTHPHGVRLDSVGMQTQYQCVSIHAPTWGATHQAR